MEYCACIRNLNAGQRTTIKLKCVWYNVVAITKRKMKQ